MDQSGKTILRLRKELKEARSVKPQLQLYCRKHGYILVRNMDDPCPECYPKRHVLQSVALPALGLGIAVGLSVVEVIRWVF